MTNSPYASINSPRGKRVAGYAALLSAFAIAAVLTGGSLLWTTIMGLPLLVLALSFQLSPKATDHSTRASLITLRAYLAGFVLSFAPLFIGGDGEGMDLLWVFAYVLLATPALLLVWLGIYGLLRYTSVGAVRSS